MAVMAVEAVPIAAEAVGGGAAAASAGTGAAEGAAGAAAAKKAPAKKAPAKKTAEKKPEGFGPAQASEQERQFKIYNQEQRKKLDADYRKQARESLAGPKPAEAPDLPTPDTKELGKGFQSWAWSGNRKLLTAEFLVCMVVLGLGTLLAPSGSKDGMPRAMVKGSALSGLFLILALVASSGKGPARVATAIGTLVTASYVLTSSDVHNVVKWIASFFSKTGDVSSKNPTGTNPTVLPETPNAPGTPTGAGQGPGTGILPAPPDLFTDGSAQ